MNYDVTKENVMYIKYLKTNIDLVRETLMCPPLLSKYILTFKVQGM